MGAQIDPKSLKLEPGGTPKRQQEPKMEKNWGPLTPFMNMESKMEKKHRSKINKYQRIVWSFVD